MCSMAQIWVPVFEGTSNRKVIHLSKDEPLTSFEKSFEILGLGAVSSGKI